LRLVAGGRYTEEEKSLSSLFRQSSTANPNPPFLTLTGDLSFDSFTYKAGLEFDAGPASLIYANIATGFKAGGFFPSVGANTFEPEELTAYTLGSKNRFLDSRLQLNIEAFYWDYQDQQVTYNGPIRASNTGVFTQASITTNVGQATMRGVEVDLQFQVTPDGLFTANAQYLDAQYESFVYNGISATGAPPRIACPATLVTSLPVAAPARIFTVDCSGKPAINAPKWTINLGYEHTFAITTGFELTAGVRTRFETSRYLSIEYLDEQRQKSYAMSDVFLTLEPESEAWSLTGFVNNIQDETVYATSIPRPILGAVYNGLRPPRTYGVRATARF
jgi:iron complex outermembrane recepter protein